MEQKGLQDEILIKKSKTKMVMLLMTLTVAPMIITIVAVGGIGVMLSSSGMDSKTVMTIQMISACILPVLCCVASWFFSRHLIRSIVQIGKTMDALATGDMSKQTLEESPVQEVDDLAKSVLGLQISLDKTIGNVKSATQWVHSDCRLRCW